MLSIENGFSSSDGLATPSIRKSFLLIAEMSEKQESMFGGDTLDLGLFRISSVRMDHF